MSQSEAWSRNGMDEAVKMLLSEKNTLFDTLTKNINSFPELKLSIRSILMEGTRMVWNTDQDAIAQLFMYGLVKNDHNVVKVANRIFETRLYNLFLSEEELKNNVFSNEGSLYKNKFIENNKLMVVLTGTYG